MSFIGVVSLSGPSNFPIKEWHLDPATELHVFELDRPDGELGSVPSLRLGQACRLLSEPCGRIGDNLPIVIVLGPGNILAVEEGRVWVRFQAPATDPAWIGNAKPELFTTFQGEPLPTDLDVEIVVA